MLEGAVVVADGVAESGRRRGASGLRSDLARVLLVLDELRADVAALRADLAATRESVIPYQSDSGAS